LRKLADDDRQNRRHVGGEGLRLFPIDEALGAIQPGETFVDDCGDCGGTLGGSERGHHQFFEGRVAVRGVDH